VVPYVLDSAFTTAERAIIAAVSTFKLTSSRERSGSVCLLSFYKKPLGQGFFRFFPVKKSIITTQTMEKFRPVAVPALQ
jgi:hypothetical protein